MKEKFLKDLEKVYKIVENEQKELQKFYEILNYKKSIIDSNLIDLEIIIDEFLEVLNLPINSESRLAAVNRIVNLREDSLIQVMKEIGFDEEEIIKAKERAYLWVSSFYIRRFEKILSKIEKDKLLTPFYREILKGAHEVGVAMSSWHSSWNAVIINGVNRELYRLFNGDEEKIFELINEKNLIEGDRSYSVLRIDKGNFEKVSYFEAFQDEVNEVCGVLDEFISSLKNLKDEIFFLEKEWISYLKKIKEALLEKDVDKLIPKWADVDRAWMKITSPIQIGHPLEYYEDHYRKSVALEWDIRVADPKYKAKSIKTKIETSFKKIYLEIDKDDKIFKNTLKNLNRVQLYIGRPFSWYGAEFNGLFSAQVVPNDETVSKEEGKKIFAYADMIFESQKAKPIMKISKIVFGDKNVKKFRKIYDFPKIWHKVYEITTIGHEYGHILWMDEDSEIKMNRSGQFKNVEEFKATVGGLISFFMFEEEDLIEYILEENIQRAVSLISWIETPEVLPYYIEGLLHLQALFDTNILDYDQKLHIDLSKKNYEKMKSWYIDRYKYLIKNYYIKKSDPKEFLKDYIEKKDNIYLPIDKKIRDFVEYYWKLYKKVGRVIES